MCSKLCALSRHRMTGVLQRVAMCCSVLQCIVVCCSVLQLCLWTKLVRECVLKIMRVITALYDWCVAVCCSVMQCDAVCCIMLQCISFMFVDESNTEERV